MSIRVGVIGTGIMGADHAAILQRDIPHATVSVLADRDLDRARSVADGVPGARCTTDALDLITSDDVDAVLIASSDDTHAQYVLACLEAGKPVLCEKPLTPNSVYARRIVQSEREAVEGKPALVSVGFMRRFDPGYVRLKELIATGQLGVPVVVNSVCRGVSAADGTSESTITSAVIHDIDAVAWLLDSSINEASWLAPRQPVQGAQRIDPQFVILRTAEGVLAPVDVFLNAKYGYDIRCEVVGSEGTASTVEPARVVREISLSHRLDYSQDWRPRFADAYRIQSQAWITSIVAGSRSPLATAEDGLRATLVAEAVIASMNSGGGFVPVAAL